jgi:ABC-type transporter Mla subunit MlaD
VKTPVGKRERAAGAFLAFAAGVVVVGALASARRTNLVDWLRPDFVVHITADQAYGVAVGSPVKLRDVDIGVVTAVGLVDDPKSKSGQVRIDARVRPEASRFLGDTSVARIVRPPFGSGMPPFGTSSIELRSSGDRALAAGATLSSEVEESLLAQVGRAAGELPGLREQALSVLSNVAGALEAMRNVADALAHGDGTAGRLLRDPDTADRLVGAVRDAHTAMQDLKQIAADMKVAAARAPAMAEEAERTEEDARKVFARADQMLEGMGHLLVTSERTLALAEELVGNLKNASKDAPVLARKVDASIDEANRLIEGAQRNFFLRGSMPDRPALRTQSETRPAPASARTGPSGAAREAGSP